MGMHHMSIKSKTFLVLFACVRDTTLNKVVFSILFEAVLTWSQNALTTIFYFAHHSHRHLTLLSASAVLIEDAFDARTTFCVGHAPGLGADYTRRLPRALLVISSIYLFVFPSAHARTSCQPRL